MGKIDSMVLLYGIYFSWSFLVILMVNPHLASFSLDLDTALIFLKKTVFLKVSYRLLHHREDKNF